MSVKKFNKNVVFFSFKPSEDFQYLKLEDLYLLEGKDKVYKVNGLYINETSLFGKSPLGVLDDCFVNLPKHLIEVIEMMLQDDEVIQAINEGKVGFKIYEYTNRKYNKKCYSIEWVDIIK